MELELLVFFVYLGIVFCVAELFGRRKHIGFWWSFFMLLGIVPGFLGLIFSPNAKKEPTKGKSIYTVFGIFFLIVFLYSFYSRIIISFERSYNYESNFFEYFFEYDGYVDFFIVISLLTTSFYFFRLGYGKVVNENPKFYFNKNFDIINKYKTNEYLYFIIENGQTSKPLNFEELKNKRIDENTMVWRKGLDTWVMAGELKELENILVYMPPQIDTPPAYNRDENQIPKFNK